MYTLFLSNNNHIILTIIKQYVLKNYKIPIIFLVIFFKTLIHFSDEQPNNIYISFLSTIQVNRLSAIHIIFLQKSNDITINNAKNIMKKNSKNILGKKPNKNDFHAIQNNSNLSDYSGGVENMSLSEIKTKNLKEEIHSIVSGTLNEMTINKSRKMK